MALLAVTSSTDFSLQVLLNITNVTFGTTRTTTATFDAGQFSATGIQSDVRWTADVHSNRIVVNGGSVDASNWIFSGWD